MKTKPTLRYFLLATLAVSSMSLHAATIDLDLTSNNSGAITLAAGNNTFTFSGFSVDYLIVAGGGSGAATSTGTNTDAGGGGGAGGLLSDTTIIDASMIAVLVGAGGATRTGNGGVGNAGQNSSAFGLTSIGGGGGGWAGNSPAAGGSGGGAGSRGSTGGDVGGSGTLNQGNAGGSRVSTGNRGGAGGGGAGGAGNDNSATNNGAGGGLGFSSNITGVTTTYAAGGGGGASGNTGATGGASATGGSGGDHNENGSAAAANTGGGGGGGAGQGSRTGGAGGSGIVVVRYTGDNLLVGGDIVSTVGGDTVHQFYYDGTGTSTAHTMGFNATVAGDISGAGDLTWDGRGTLTLTGTSAFDGSTTVNASMLAILGSVTTSNLAFLNDGTINLGSTGQLFVLASNYSLTDASDDIAAGNISGDNPLFVSTFNDGSDDYVFFNAIPEPTTALLGGLGFLMLLRRRR